MRSSLVAALAAAAMTLTATSARADGAARSPESDDPALYSVTSQRRNGLVLGASGGVAFAGASGYPNNARLIDNPDYHSASPLMVGWAASFFALGAFTDWLSFGPTFAIATFESAAWKSTGWGVGFRAEVFPLISLVPALADLAVYGQLGVGTTELHAKGPYPDADGTQSFFGAGVHREWRLGQMLGGHAAIGPYVEYDTIFAQSIERHWLTAGIRVAFYGGSVALDRRR